LLKEAKEMMDSWQDRELSEEEKQAEREWEELEHSL
jgi:hypothetical protein